jgi:ketosteroid isomerase-like protein
MADNANVEIALRYVEALSSGEGPEEIGQFYAPDVVQEEFPNRLLPDGATRDLAALKDGRKRGQALLSAEHYEVVGTIGDGDYVALELRWTATIGIKAGSFRPGDQLCAHFAVFLEFHRGRIVRQRNYDCFDPW